MFDFVHHATVYKRNTFCVEVSEKLADDLLKAVSDTVLKALSNVEIKVNFGVAKVHPVDKYNKKIGREVAISKVKECVFYLGTFMNRGEIILLNIFNKDYDLTFRIKAGHKPYLIEASVL